MAAGFRPGSSMDRAPRPTRRRTVRFRPGAGRRHINFEFVFKQLLAGFDRLKVRYAAMGAFGMGALGAERATKDLDFLVHGGDMESVHGLMAALKYARIFESPNVSQYRGETVVWGWVDFFKAFRPLAIEMLGAAIVKPVFGGPMTVRVLRPEDLIGFKVQAVANAPERRPMDTQDIEMLAEVYRGRLDWARVERYYTLFGLGPMFLDLKKRHGNP